METTLKMVKLWWVTSCCKSQVSEGLLREDSIFSVRVWRPDSVTLHGYRCGFSSNHFGRHSWAYTFHDGSMGLVDLPTFTIKKQPNVDKYIIHGSYGYNTRQHIPTDIKTFQNISIWIDKWKSGTYLALSGNSNNQKQTSKHTPMTTDMDSQKEVWETIFFFNRGDVFRTHQLQKATDTSSDFLLEKLLHHLGHT